MKSITKVIILAGRKNSGCSDVTKPASGGLLMGVGG